MSNKISYVLRNLTALTVEIHLPDETPPRWNRFPLSSIASEADLDRLAQSMAPTVEELEEKAAAPPLPDLRELVDRPRQADRRGAKKRDATPAPAPAVEPMSPEQAALLEAEEAAAFEERVLAVLTKHKGKP
jgi:hypothetical protein